MDVQVHAQQDKRPENRCEQGGNDLLDVVQIRPVMVRRGDDPACH